jgi:hypothetical protein
MSVSLGLQGDRIVVTGDTLKCKKVLKEAGGRWNKGLVAWTFASSEKEALTEALNGCGMEVEDNTAGDSKRPLDDSSVDSKSPKRIKTDPDPGAGGSGAASKDDNGDYFFELSAKKRVTVRKYRNMVLVDIREFYGEPGELKPGKKGISLTADQWSALKGAFNEIDGAIETI